MKARFNKNKWSTLQPDSFALYWEDYDNVEKVIKEEPMLYGASIEFARKKGGVLTNKVLNKIENRVEELIPSQAKMGYHPVIDTKSVMLMPNWYPCIAGWHCDGVIRADRNSQPDLSTLNQDVRHFTCAFNSAQETGTQFLRTVDGGVVFNNIDEDNVWKSVDEEVDDRGFVTDNAVNGQVVEFSRDTLHRCPPVKSRQWRYFFRLSFYHMPAMNEIRNQVQVYIDKNQGW